MKSRPALLSRRVALGAMLAIVPATRLALGQAARDAVPNQDRMTMRIRIAFHNQSMTAGLHDNPSARDFLSMLPLDLTIDDYSTNEKISYLPRKLTEQGAGPFGDEAPGDLCYYAPWGNLAFFYGSYRYSRGLIRLGRIDGGIAPLLVRGKFDLHVGLLP